MVARADRRLVRADRGNPLLSPAGAAARRTTSSGRPPRPRTNSPSVPPICSSPGSQPRIQAVGRCPPEGRRRVFYRVRFGHRDLDPDSLRSSRMNDRPCPPQNAVSERFPSLDQQKNLRGMRVGLVGFAGSGKSTLFRAPHRNGVRSRQDPLGAGGSRRAVRPATRLPGLAAQPQEGDAGHGRVPRHARTDLRDARRQPAAAGRDPRGRRPADRPERLRRRRPGRPSWPRSARRCCSPTSASSPTASSGSRPASRNAGPTGSKQEKELAIVKARAGDARRRQVRRHPRPLGRRQEAAPIVRAAHRQAPGGRAQRAPGPGRPAPLWALAPEALAIDAKLELELAQLEPDERAAFMTDLGVTELGRDRIIRAAYDAVGIITFFTAGEPEVRGWNLERERHCRRGRRQDPYRPGQGLHPRRGHRLRRPSRRRLAQGSQGQAPATARRKGIRRQGRRHHLLPQRCLTATERLPGLRSGDHRDGDRSFRRRAEHSAGVSGESCEAGDRGWLARACRPGRTSRRPGRTRPPATLPASPW